LVVDTGTWLSGRKVLIPPVSLCLPNAQMSIFPVKLTKKQVSDSPDIDTDKPVSLQHQITLDLYFQFFPFMPTGIMPGSTVMPAMVEVPKDQPSDESKQSDPHLRSTRHVAGYHVEATDYRFGSVTDFIIDDENWIIRYLAVDTINWLPSKWVLVPASQIAKINWEERNVYINSSREVIRNAPQYLPKNPLEDEYVKRLCDYYDQSK
jgi:hypothetical protein